MVSLGNMTQLRQRCCVLLCQRTDALPALTSVFLALKSKLSSPMLGVCTVPESNCWRMEASGPCVLWVLRHATPQHACTLASCWCCLLVITARANTATARLNDAGAAYLVLEQFQQLPSVLVQFQLQGGWWQCAAWGDLLQCAP
jgi:hypothetical protein